MLWGALSAPQLTGASARLGTGGSSRACCGQVPCPGIPVGPGMDPKASRDGILADPAFSKDVCAHIAPPPALLPRAPECLPCSGWLCVLSLDTVPTQRTRRRCWRVTSEQSLMPQPVSWSWGAPSWNPGRRNPIEPPAALPSSCCGGQRGGVPSEPCSNGRCMSRIEARVVWSCWVSEWRVTLRRSMQMEVGCYRPWLDHAGLKVLEVLGTQSLILWLLLTRGLTQSSM